MLLSLAPKHRCRWAGALVIVHLMACVLLPWFHAHPGEDHADLKGNSYHSHAEPFASHAAEREDDDHQQAKETAHLLFEGIRPMPGMLAAYGNPYDFRQSSPAIDFIDPAVVFASHAPLPAGFLSKIPISPSLRDYCVLTATNLSPPQA